MSLISVALTLCVAASAHAATIFQINGGGNGHGIGMSQYGAYGYALHGKTYQFILGHYYSGTSLGSTNPNQVVQVLLATGPAHFSGANRAGNHKLNSNLTYSVRTLANGMLGLFGPTGKKVGRFASTLNVTGSAPLTLAGHGTYRGAFQFSVVGGAVQTVNAIGLDNYVRGVVAAEVPASWPTAALEAQAVAARTYAITDSVQGDGYQLYDDTRSQMYGGVGAETPATDAAVAATSGQIVTYEGAPATTYFFSSSGGHTENIENVWLGDAPEPWLKGVPDPYDGAAGQDPYHRWTVRMTLAKARKKLGGLVEGRLRGIRVTKRGVSPRVVDAEVVGSQGTTQVTGPELQSLFGLMSTYMRFTTISATTISRPRISRAAFERVRSPYWGTGTLTGTVYPAGRGAVVSIQIWGGKHWRTVKTLRLRDNGTYRVEVAAPGSYRALYGQVAGPTVALG
ncbi:MAG TPA: SpoIID/LytB domain-containing protein [Solirubrobacteraceae bacterium]|nr:SpoIID/LytB domain-containing protein [Solirubrobacteraceae bacterium]